MTSIGEQANIKESSILRFFWPAVVFFVNFFHKLRYINQRDVSLDEPWSIFHAQLPPREIVSVLLEGNNPPLFELLLHYWMLIFGNDPASVRFLPLIFSSLLAAVLFRFGQKYFSWYAGLIAAVLFTFNTMHYFFALETRVYSLLALLTALSIYSFVSLCKRPGSTKYLIMLTLSNVFIGYAHYFGLLVIFGEAVVAAGLLLYGERKFFRQVIISMGAFVLLYLPVLYNLYQRYISTVQGGTWNTPPSGMREFFLHPLAFFNGLYPLQQFSKIVLAGLVLIIIYWWISARRPKIKVHKVHIAVILLLLWIIPYSIMFFGSYKTPMFIIRYTLFTSVPLYLFLAALLHLLFGRNPIIYTLVVAFGVFYFTRSLQINPDYFYHREVKSAVNKVKELRYDESIPVIIHPHFTYFGFLYYYDRELFSQPARVDSALKAQNIYPTWGFDITAEIVSEQNPQSLIYYQNGSPAEEATAYMYNRLPSVYKIDTSYFYPQTFHVTRFTRTNQQ